jgi:hypothetical protein
MKAKYKKELNKAILTIETNQLYKEDYQIKMLRENHIEGLLKVECHHIDGETVFLYDVNNMLPLKRKFELVELKQADIISIVETLIKTIDELQQYLLVPDSLVLDPNLIYWDKTRWYFLYLPGKASDLNKVFHDLTEYFVKTLDYNEMEGIKVASLLHKETLQESFNVKEILEKYKEQYEGERKEELSINSKTKQQSDNMMGIMVEDYNINQPMGGEDEKIKDLGNLEKNTNNRKDNNEKKLKFAFLHKVKEGKVRTQSSRWGDWKDMIID